MMHELFLPVTATFPPYRDPDYQSRFKVGGLLYKPRFFINPKHDLHIRAAKAVLPTYATKISPGERGHRGKKIQIYLLR